MDYYLTYNKFSISVTSTELVEVQGLGSDPGSADLSISKGSRVLQGPRVGGQCSAGYNEFSLHLPGLWCQWEQKSMRGCPGAEASREPEKGKRALLKGQVRATSPPHTGRSPGHKEKTYQAHEQMLPLYKLSPQGRT